MMDLFSNNLFVYNKMYTKETNVSHGFNTNAFFLTNSYLTNAYQISQIRLIMLLHIFHHSYATVMKKYVNE